MEFRHYPVMLGEVIEGLDIKPDGVYVDCTLGGAGHTKEILKHLSGNGRVIGIDRDGDAIANAEKTVNDERLLLYRDNFSNIADAVSHYGFEKIDGVLIDLGVSSYQLDNAERGFSYINDAPLDMRMNRADRLNAYDVVNSYTKEALEKIFFEFGEEKFSGKIADRIVEKRKTAPIESTAQLAAIIASAIPKSVKFDGHPAKRCFQAIRIEVNGELDVIEPTLRTGCDLLKSGGRMTVLTFHSLEDRIVKNVFRELENPCKCPKDLPCVCGKMPVARVLTRKPSVPSEQELAENSRSKSAKLRIIEKL